MNKEKKVNKKFSKTRKWLLIILTFFLVFIGLNWPTNYYIEMPGSAVSIGQFVKSDVKPPSNFYLVTVSETSQPATVWEYLFSFTQKHGRVSNYKYCSKSFIRTQRSSARYCFGQLQ